MESCVIEHVRSRCSLSGAATRQPQSSGPRVDLSDLATSARWHVLHTKSRQEKALADVLASRDISYFLPLVKRVAYHGGRRRIVESPLFTGYLFLRGTLEDTYTAISTKRVVQAVAVADQNQLDHELQQIRFALSQGGVLDPFPYLKAGRRARVTGGPFRGLEGIVETRMREDRLALQVQTLGRATSLEIDASLLEPLD